MSYHAVAIVSDKYVLRRFKWILQKVLGPDIEVKTHPASYTNRLVLQQFEDEKWWNHDLSRAMVISESQKFLFYWLKYGILSHTEVSDVPFDSIFEWISDERIRDTGYQQKKILDQVKKFCNA